MPWQFHACKRPVHFIALVLAVTVPLLPGCGESHTPSGTVRSHLKQICLGYNNYLASRKRPPERREDLEPFLEGGVYYTDSGSYVDDEAQRRFKNGEYVAVWGLSLTIDSGEDIVVAYEKRTPLTGGFVVMALVHEAYLQLVGTGKREASWDHRGHFFAAAAEADATPLAENARRKQRDDHGGGRLQCDLEKIT